MATFTIIDIQEDTDGRLFVDWQCTCGPNGDVMVRKTGPFVTPPGGEHTIWDEVRLWLALNAEEMESQGVARGTPSDIAELVGTPTETAVLRERYAVNLAAFRERQATLDITRDG